MPDLAWWLDNFQHTAFRLETLPHYSIPEEADMLAAFSRGEPVRLPDNHPWPELVRRHVRVGKVMQRVRVVSQPLANYERFELSLYPRSVAAGEHIRITTENPGAGDYWLFDDHTAIVIHYDAGGGFVGTEQANDVVTYRRIRDLALANSVPLADFSERVSR
jgi:hypothetical protein